MGGDMQACWMELVKEVQVQGRGEGEGGKRGDVGMLVKGV